jgi:hypothetical protein
LAAERRSIVLGVASRACRACDWALLLASRSACDGQGSSEGDADRASAVEADVTRDSGGPPTRDAAARSAATGVMQSTPSLEITPRFRAQATTEMNAT